ncbi:helicase/secretion neighborhood TadE-like protein [Kytococcus aerolatus]|uniref:Helicase/secretion neighborhood TadE-like protein n=1 Tax=Kytococcus aerolatus TaxID=592308 RepID=A0A212U6B9_9MICO|nr:Rv3654c family TadE-like protein [Kytococcus aerolatus]SNC73803.1 helicase/secretion neighborhood TadE-like protein [Kytococcus aerolatus]
MGRRHRWFRRATERWLHRAERGSGTMAAMLVCTVLLSLLASGIVAGQCWLAASTARTAADLSSLAASGDTEPTVLSGQPCLTARQVARDNGASLRSCRVDGFDVTVEVSVDSGTPFGEARARSTAGPRPGSPPGSPPRRTPPPRVAPAPGR